MARWCLDVSREWDGDFSKDDVITKAVGKQPSDSGAGMGSRDMGFWFETEEEAKAALRRVIDACRFSTVTHIWLAD